MTGPCELCGIVPMNQDGKPYTIHPCSWEPRPHCLGCHMPYNEREKWHYPPKGVTLA